MQATLSSTGGTLATFKAAQGGCEATGRAAVPARTAGGGHFVLGGPPRPGTRSRGCRAACHGRPARRVHRPPQLPAGGGGRGRTSRRRRRHFRAGGRAEAAVRGPAPGGAMGILEKISEIEKEIARTQKNKGALLPPPRAGPHVPATLLAGPGAPRLPRPPGQGSRAGRGLRR